MGKNAAIDSVSMNHLLQKPRTNPDGEPTGTALDEHIKKGRFCVAMDKQRAIIHEWEQTCGHEYIAALVTKWSDLNGFEYVKTPGRLTSNHIKRLIALGFKDQPIDKLLLRTAMGSNHQRLVSNDSDFWDPKKPPRHRVGDSNAAVAKYCQDELCVTVLVMDALLGELEAI